MEEFFSGFYQMIFNFLQNSHATIVFSLTKTFSRPLYYCIFTIARYLNSLHNIINAYVATCRSQWYTCCVAVLLGHFGAPSTNPSRIPRLVAYLQSYIRPPVPQQPPRSPLPQRVYVGGYIYMPACIAPVRTAQRGVEVSSSSDSCLIFGLCTRTKAFCIVSLLLDDQYSQILSDTDLESSCCTLSVPFVQL